MLESNEVVVISHDHTITSQRFDKQTTEIPTTQWTVSVASEYTYKIYKKYYRSQNQDTHGTKWWRLS